MRKVFLASLIILALLAGPVIAQDQAAQAQAPAKAKSAVKLETELDKVCYGLGVQFGSFLKRGSIQLNKDMLMQGVDDVLANREPAMTDMEIQTTVKGYMDKARKDRADKNLKDGEAFLQANATKEGVKALPSGLQYKVLKEGDGPSPTANDKVKVQYTGTLIDGTKFDSSVDRGQPAIFGVSQVIKGWTEGIQLMKKGAKWQLFIPASLAYGGADKPKIPGNSVLIFDVELLDINPADAPVVIENKPTLVPGAVQPPPQQTPGAQKPAPK